MGKAFLFTLITLLLVLSSVDSASTTSPAKIVNGLVSNAMSASKKWISSLKATTKTAIVGRPLVKYESGFAVETVFDGSKLGIEPFSVEVLPNGELLILDSSNSNLYKISSSLSLYSRPRLIAGSAEGYSGHVDGRLRDARLNHPKGLAVDDKGNIYIADTMNMAIRKISDSGVTTIAGGKWSKGGGHVDGPSEDAKFSNDFDVVYIGSSCSLLVIDRGNRAIREIQLNFDDCAYQYGSGFPLGFAVLLGAGFFGYMLALLQFRVHNIVSSQNDQMTTQKSTMHDNYKTPLKSVRPPLIPSEDGQEKEEEGFFGSLGKLFMSGGVCLVEILGAIFPVFRKKQLSYQHLVELHNHQQPKHSPSWPVQESFVIPDEDEPPSLETRDPTPKKTYPFMSKDPEKIHQLRQSRALYSGWDGEFNEKQQQHQQQKQHHHHHRYHSSIPRTYYEQSHERTKEVVFGAAQELNGKREAVAVKPVDYADPIYNRQNIHSRVNSMGYINGY